LRLLRLFGNKETSGPRGLTWRILAWSFQATVKPGVEFITKYDIME